MTKTCNITQARKDFPILEQHCYLDSAATSQKPLQVIEAMREFMTNSNGTVRRGVYELSVQSTQAFDQARETVRKFVNAKSSNEIIFTKGTTESINMLAYSFTEWLRLGQKEISKTSDIRPVSKHSFDVQVAQKKVATARNARVAFGDNSDFQNKSIDSGNKSTAAEILISGLEHHANIVPWQIHCNRIGAKLKSIPVLDNGELDLEACKTLLASGKVKLVAVTALANSTGTIVPVKEITEIAHQHGALVLVDGAQAVAHQKIDLQDLDVDFFAFSGHKLYGPTGIGVLYGKEKYLNAMPPYHGGGEMIDKVTLTETSFAQAPFRFEAGTPPIIEAIGLGAAIDYINNLGIENISQYENKLYSYALSKAKEIEGLKIIASTENKTGIISFVFDDIGSFDIGTMMNEHGVAIRTGHHCAQPVMTRFGVDSTARISIAFYNNREDIDKCFEALAKTVRIFR